MEELYKKYRPRTLDEVYGQIEAVSMLKEMLNKNNLPHSILLTGPSGCGKTTIARILKSELKCSDLDYSEINCADSRGIDFARELRYSIGLSPLSGICRIFYIDEAHQLTNQAQKALLKTLEDTPEHIYFILASTEPNKIIREIHTRCTEIKLSLLSDKVLEKIIVHVLEKEEKIVSIDTLTKVAECAEGSPRKALVLLHQIIDLKNEEEQLEALSRSESKRNSIELFRLLIDSRSRWKDVAECLKMLSDEPETVRHIILSCASRTLLGASKGASRAYLILVAFGDNFYDSKKSGLIRACYEVMNPEE